MPKYLELRRPAPPKEVGMEDVVAAIHQLGAKLEQKPSAQPGVTADSITEAMQGLEFVLPEPAEPKARSYEFTVTERDNDGKILKFTVKET